MKSQTRLSVRSINQSNRSISVRLSFLFCLRVFISRSYENRSKCVSDWSIQVCTRAVERAACLACERVFSLDMLK